MAAGLGLHGQREFRGPAVSARARCGRTWGPIGVHVAAAQAARPHPDPSADLGLRGVNGKSSHADAVRAALAMPLAARMERAAAASAAAEAN